MRGASCWRKHTAQLLVRRSRCSCSSRVLQGSSSGGGPRLLAARAMAAAGAGGAGPHINVWGGSEEALEGFRRTFVLVRVAAAGLGGCTADGGGGGGYGGRCVHIP